MIENYIMSSDEFENSVIDLRESNGAKKSFNEWFDFANTYISSTDTKFHDRWHDLVEWVTMWISIKHFIQQVKEYYISKYKDDQEKNW